MTGVRSTVRPVSSVAILVAATGRAAAHGGSLGAGTRASLTIPTWLFLVTGGSLVGASFLLASFVTDRSFVAAAEQWHRTVSLPAAATLTRIVRAVGVVGLIAVVVVGLVGPADPIANLAVLLVWVGWWAGLAMSAYLFGNVWPALNPWRTLATALPSLDRGYPDRLGAWPSVAGLLALVWLEVVSPLAGDARLLVAVVLGYTLVTLAGAAVFGDEWFETVDPVSRVFRYYGHVAPLRRVGDRLRVRPYGGGLTDPVVDGPGEVAFVVALLWVTSFDGLVSTPAWKALLTPLVRAGVPAHLLYPAGLLVGFGLFLGAYRLAVRASRRSARTYLAPGEISRRFVPPLLAIAAGYHLAHFLGYFLSLAPALAAAATAPLSSATAVPVLALPGWFGGVAMAAVLVGHVLAIWVAHATAFEIFPGRLQAIRSQYPFIAVMVFYTMTSLWIVSSPDVQPPFL